MSGSSVIWIVRKHPVVNFGWRRGGTLKAFEIHSTHATRKEAAAVAKDKNEKSQRFHYMTGKVELK